MVQLNQVVNVNDIPERSDYTPIQPGTYTGMIVKSEEKPNGPNSKDPNGSQYVLEIDIVDGEYAGRKLFERLNLKNSSDKARDIAMQTLGEIIKALGKVTITDTDELHNKRFLMEVVVDPGKPYQKDGQTVEGKPQNRIKKYLPMGVGATGSAAAGTPAGNAGAASAPWKR